jgi:PAS domain S-box-containing protein
LRNACFRPALTPALSQREREKEALSNVRSGPKAVCPKHSTRHAAQPITDMTDPLDYRTAFELAPIGLVISRQRLMLDCNRQLLEMFCAEPEQVIGHSFEVLYPTHDEFERTGARIVASLGRGGFYADERVMKRVGGRQAGELFWCHVSGRALDPAHPHASGIWSFEDLSSRRKVGAELTAREREIAALLIEGLTSKLIGKRLAISPRTVDVYRARLMRKYGSATTPELVHKLLSA